MSCSVVCANGGTKSCNQLIKLFLDQRGRTTLVEKDLKDESTLHDLESEIRH